MRNNVIQIVKTSLALFILLSLLTGLLYPLAITGVVQTLIPDKADGSLLISNGVVIGSDLIGQRFTSPEYFHGRPSIVGYSANNSGASNLGPSSAKLKDKTQENLAAIKRANMMPLNSSVPADLVLASGSGLDPHISIESARLQASRVARARNISESDVQDLINEQIELPYLGILGQSRINVLRLNLRLDRLGEVS
ncbi:MAG: potassium-transporting ATPase subunit KdpC [Methanotrichaceae archaeon]|nr:potassium-transporting ATPase subunit KdpC [Methanotrichaceae archaeon]